MRRAILALVVVTMLTTGSAEGRILGLVGKTSTGQAAEPSAYSRWTWETVALLCKQLGIPVDYYLASDTTGITAAIATGNYSKAVTCNLPTLSASYDTDAELSAVGWPYLGMWIDRNSAKAFEIELVIASPSDIPSTEVWATAFTGILGTRQQSTFSTTNEVPITNAAGDSIYANVHFNSTTRYVPRIPDSLSWCTQDVWFDLTQPTTNQKYCNIWHTTGTGDHRVTYVRWAMNSGWCSSVLGILARGENITPIDMPLLLGGFGYYNVSWMPDSTGWGANLENNFETVVDYAVARGMKLDFLCNSYQWAKGQNLRALYPDIETKVAANLDNVRFTHETVSSWSAAMSYTNWFGALHDRTQAQIESMINLSVDSTAAQSGNLPAIISGTRCSAYNGYMYGQAGVGSQNKTFAAIANTDIDEIYIRGNSYAEMPPRSKNFGLLYPARKLVRKTDGTLKEIRFYPYSRDIGLMWNVDSDSTAFHVMWPTLGGTYVQAKAERGLFSATWFRHTLGFYFYDKGAQDGGWPRGNEKNAEYQPGINIPAAMLTGGAPAPTNCNLIAVLRDVHAHKGLADALAGQTVIRYCWMEDVKWDRRNGAKWPNSHVKRQ